jgi:tRNA threonylcarbamoyladenosine biosynthesis protein TsaE
MEVIFKLDNIRDAAEKLLAAAGSNKVFAFHGEMGAGKTTFIHALCEVLQVKGTVSSPTFSIINQYSTEKNQTIYHMDLYRLKDEHEAINAGIEDCLYSGNTCLVEWPEKAPGIFPADTLHVTITLVASNTRKLNTSNPWKGITAFRN